MKKICTCSPRDPGDTGKTARVCRQKKSFELPAPNSMITFGDRSRSGPGTGAKP